MHLEFVTNTHQTQPVLQILRLQQCTGCAQFCTRNFAKHFIYTCSCRLCRTKVVAYYHIVQMQFNQHSVFVWFLCLLLLTFLLFVTVSGVGVTISQ